MRHIEAKLSFINAGFWGIKVIWKLVEVLILFPLRISDLVTTFDELEAQNKLLLAIS